MATWAGFKSGEHVVWQNDNQKIQAIVADYNGKVPNGCVPILLLTEQVLKCVPADSLYRK